MRFIFTVISILIVVAVVFLAALNPNILFDFTVWNSDKTHVLTYHVDLIQILLLNFTAGILAGAFFVGSFSFSTKKKLKEYQRKLEKTCIQSTDESSKVAVLEAKIEVLEKALKSALENKNE